MESPPWLVGMGEMVMQTGKKPPWLLRYRSSSWFICATVSIAVFTDVFLYAVIVPVMPYALTERSGIDLDSVQHWNSVLIAVYGAALLAFSPICGWLADYTPSRRVPLLLGLIALAGATIMLNIGTSIGVLIAGRLLQGTSAAVVWVVGLALLVDTVGQSGVGQAMGYVSMSMSLAVLIAPLLGGVVFAKGGYTAVFAMAYALIGLDVVLRLVLVEKKIARRWEDADVVADLQVGEGRSVGYGATATTAAAAGDGDGDGDTEKTETSADVAGLEPTTAADAEKASITASSPAPANPTPPLTGRYRLPPALSLVTSKRLSASLWGTLVVSILFSSLDAVLPLYVRQTFGWSSVGAGLIFLPIVIPSFAAPLFGRVADRSSPRWPVAAGFVAACPLFVLLRLVVRDSLRQKALLCALLALMGLALASILPCIMAEITYVVAAKEDARPGLFGAKGAYAQAYGLFNMAWAGGALVGPIWAGYVKDVAGWGTMAWTLGLLSACSATPALLWCGGWIGRGRGEREADDV